MHVFSTHGGMTFAARCLMRRVLGFLAGVLVGQWLVFGGALSPADLHIRAAAAWEHRDYPEALRLWSQAASLQPGNAELHYLRGRALAALGLRASAADAFQVTLLLEPRSTIAREAMDGLAGLQPTSAGDGEVLVPLESGLGVWIVPALVNGHRGRFLLDTGSSVIVVGPTLAAAAGLKAAADREAIELQTLGGRTRGPSAIVTSVKVGDAVLRDVPVVLHDPGPGVDGILGNTFLSHYLVTVDADRRQLGLSSPGRPAAE
jgi:clan AA aspartic protease (TIGR02281 family)